MIQHETGRVAVVFGLDTDGNQAYTLEIDGVDTFEAWAGLRMMANFLESWLQDALRVDLDGLGDDEDEGDDSDDPSA